MARTRLPSLIQRSRLTRAKAKMTRPKIKAGMNPSLPTVHACSLTPLRPKYGEEIEKPALPLDSPGLAQTITLRPPRNKVAIFGAPDGRYAFWPSGQPCGPPSQSAPGASRSKPARLIFAPGVSSATARGYWSPFPDSNQRWPPKGLPAARSPTRRPPSWCRRPCRPGYRCRCPRS